MCTRGHWRPVEDEKLKELVERYGPHNWNTIAENLPGRSGKSCRLRWFNQLDPRITRSPFTEEEEERLIASHRIHGNKWSIIARQFPGRTDNAIKNHWHVLRARRSRERLRFCIKSAPLLRNIDEQTSPSRSASTTNLDSNSNITSFIEKYYHSLEEFYHNIHNCQPVMLRDGNDSIEFYDFLCVNTEDSEKQSKNCMGGDDTIEEGDVDNERRHNEAAVPFIDFLAMESSS